MKNLISFFMAVLASPANAQSNLPDLLIAIEAQLAEKRPDFVSTLRPPLTDADIAALEATYAITLPEQVKDLYKWHDGQDPQGFTTFVNNMQLQPLDAVLSTKSDLDGMIGYDFTLENWWHPGWLPIMHNGGGDYLVVDTAGIHTGDTGQLVAVYHDWEYRPIEAENLFAFMQAVLAYYENTPVDKMDEFYFLDRYLADTGQSFDASGPAVPLDKMGNR